MNGPSLMIDMESSQHFPLAPVWRVQTKPKSRSMTTNSNYSHLQSLIFITSFILFSAGVD